MLCYANVIQKFSHSLSRHQILKVIVKYKTHPSLISTLFTFLLLASWEKIAFLKASKFHKVVQKSDLHIRILKENADCFAEYTCFEIEEAIAVRISVQIWVFSARNFPVVKSGKIRTNKSLHSDSFMQWISSSTFTASSKFANVIIVFKQGSGNLREKERPISILPIISKTFGKLICGQLSNHFDNILAKLRSSHRCCSVRKSVLRNFTKFTGKHLCQSAF